MLIIGQNKISASEYHLRTAASDGLSLDIEKMIIILFSAMAVHQNANQRHCLRRVERMIFFLLLLTSSDYLDSINRDSEELLIILNFAHVFAEVPIRESEFLGTLRFLLDTDENRKAIQPVSRSFAAKKIIPSMTCTRLGCSAWFQPSILANRPNLISSDRTRTAFVGKRIIFPNMPNPRLPESQVICSWELV